MRSAFLPPPAGIPCVGWPNPRSTELKDYCTYVEIGQCISLCEYKDGNYFYSVTLQADETPLVVCALDHYITDNLHQEAGRRCDYLCMGWYNGDCFIAFIELRKEVDVERQFEDKSDQVRQTINLLCRENPIFGNILHQNKPAIFNLACNPVKNHKIIGVIIPAVHSASRAEQSKNVEIEGNGLVPIVVIPNRILKDGQTTWTRLLQQIVPLRNN
jgi:hypothetical protein